MRMIVRQGLMLSVIGILLGIPLVLVQIKAIQAIFAGLVPVEPASVLGCRPGARPGDPDRQRLAGAASGERRPDPGAALGMTI